MNKETYTNRYNDTYTFTPDEDGNLLWEGNFKWCRFSWPNDYTKAYEQYLKDVGVSNGMSLDEFKKKVHEYDDEKCEYVMKDYISLIESVKDKIDMVDPSGGPYITTEMNAEIFHSKMEGKKIKEIQPIKTGYKLILKDEG